MVFILILSAIFSASCSCKEENLDISISIAKTEFSLALNDTVDLKQYVTIDGCNNGFECEISNGAVLSIENGVVTPKSGGVSDVKCKVKGFGDYFVVAKFTINGVYLAETASVSLDKVIINLGAGKIANNKVIVDNKVTETPSISCDTSIATYNYSTGEVYAKSLGETVVTVAFERCEVSFEVVVENNIFVEQLDLRNTTMYVGDTSTFDFTVIPSNANQLRFYTESNILEVDNRGSYVAKEAGGAVVYCDYYLKGDTATKQTKSFYVSINAIPDYLDFSIMSTGGQPLEYMFASDTAKIVFDMEHYEMLENFTFSDNIEVLSSGIESGLDGSKYVLFKAKNLGLLNVEVSAIARFDGTAKMMTKERSITVYSFDQISVEAKYDIYEIDADKNGNYYITFGSIVTSLSFSCKINGNDLSDIKVYAIAGSVKTELENGIFEIENQGENVIAIEYCGQEIKRFKVVVE